METNNEKQEEIGPRAFSVVIQKLADGDAHRQLSEDLHRLLKECARQAKARVGTVKGSLTLKLNVVVDEREVAVIGYQIERKEPQPKRATSVMFVDKTGNLTENNPRQVELGLKDVSRKTGPARDVPAANQQEG